MKWFGFKFRNLYLVNTIHDLLYRRLMSIFLSKSSNDLIKLRKLDFGIVSTRRDRQRWEILFEVEVKVII